MPECNYTAPLTLCSTQVERNCPKCDDGMKLKTMLPRKVGMELGDKETARYNSVRILMLRSSQVEHVPEINERFPQFQCFTSVREACEAMHALNESE